jgi:hypothetical protein
LVLNNKIARPVNFLFNKIGKRYSIEKKTEQEIPLMIISAKPPLHVMNNGKHICKIKRL